MLRARWDSEAFPPGRYEFRATGYDDAGNATTTQMRLDRSVMALANPLKAQTALSIGFGGERLIWQNCTHSNGGRHCRREAVSALERRPQARVVPYGRGTLISGRLATKAGAPIAGAPVRIAEQLGNELGGSERITTVSTDSAGWFSVRLEEGPSREISATFGRLADADPVGGDAASDGRAERGQAAGLVVDREGRRPARRLQRPPDRRRGADPGRGEASLAAVPGPGNAVDRVSDGAGPTRGDVSATPTGSATTTAAGSDSSFGPRPQRKATGLTSREARGQSLCSGSEEGLLAERGELLADLVDQVLGAGGLLVESLCGPASRPRCGCA